MLVSFVLKGLATGLSISAPIGPVGVLCIRRSLALGRSHGLVTGLGAATADVLYGCATGFGMNAISGFLIREKTLLGLVGGVLLCIIGLAICWRTPDPAAAPVPAEASMLSAYFSALVITMVNPMTGLSLVAIFSGFGIGLTTDRAEIAVFICGIGLGAMLWWFLLSRVVVLFRSRITVEWMRTINRLSGLVILALGVHLIVSSQN